jgi:beta-lactam-binding protein with PASTA domain
LLIQKKLLLLKTTEQYNEKYPQGYVVSQIPKAKSFVKEGRHIYLVISKGRETVTAPYLIKQSLRYARLIMIKKGLQLGNITYHTSDSVGIDTIIAQKIYPGQNIPYGSSIDVVVSQGSGHMVKVPDLAGNPFADVEKVLSQSGLVLGSVSYGKSETFMPNTVISQTPSSGELIPKGAKVHIIVVR